MRAYMILQAAVHDPDRYAQYAARSGAVMAAHGGRFLVRGGAIETVEGDWSPQRLVVAEFASMEAARAWHASDAYQQILPIRLEAADAQLVFVEGVAQEP